MPIRLTTAYAERLVTDRLLDDTRVKADVLLVSQFWKRLNQIDKSAGTGPREKTAILLQQVRSAAERLLNDPDSLYNCNALKRHERFEISLLTSVVHAIVEAASNIIEATNAKRIEKKKGSNSAEGKESDRFLLEKVESLSNCQISFLIGAPPTDYINDFVSEASSLTISLLSTIGFQFENPSTSLKELIATSRKVLDVWLVSGGESAKLVVNYLNYQHQSAWAARVSDDVKSLQQALEHWLQPKTDAAKKRDDAWSRYRSSLQSLPDSKETMFDEQFGVRKVFVQPIANYKVAGSTHEKGTTIPDVANLIAGLISERIPGDELILLCGGPGSGKSTLCRIIASELALNSEIHPVFLRLRRLQDTQDIATFIETQLQKEGVIDKFSDLAEISNLVLILDGFDELVMATRGRLREFFNALREDLGSGPLRKAKAIVSGRDTLFPNGNGLPTGSHVISLLPFDRHRIEAWGAKWRTLHASAPGASFKPEIFYDEKGEKSDSKVQPLHHLISWPLTLHLVARVHNAGALDLGSGKRQTVEKATLYKSIISETALRQQDQSAGKGRLSAEQMREFVQAIAWEMYSTSRDALDHTEGLPLLKSIYPGATEAELADFADVAIVNQPELTKGEEGGFEFVHKSFSEYFVAETFARTIEKISFKALEYDSDKLSWRRSIKDALGDLSSLISIRVLTAEVQEMLSPMLADFKEFSGPTPKVKKTSNDTSKLLQKKERIEELIVAYANGSHQRDVVDPVRGSRIVRNEREIHANFSLGILIIGCALATRLTITSTESKMNFALKVDDNKLWKFLSIIQAGDIQLGYGLAERCLAFVEVSSGETLVEVLYPPIPRRLLTGVKGATFPLSEAIDDLVSLAGFLMIENLILSFSRLNQSGSMGDLFRPTYTHPRDRGHSRMFSEAVRTLELSGTMPTESDRKRDRLRLHRSVDRLIEELSHDMPGRLRSSKGDPMDWSEVRSAFRELSYGLEHHAGGYYLPEMIDRIEYLVRRRLR